MKLPIGRMAAPTRGWFIIRGRRGHHAFCDEVRVFDLSKGSVYGTQSCSGLALTDAVLLLQSLFRGGGALACEDAADANDDGGLNVTDAVYVLAHLFLSGPAPPDPFPEAGGDPTEDALGCSGV